MTLTHGSRVNRSDWVFNFRILCILVLKTEKQKEIDKNTDTKEEKIHGRKYRPLYSNVAV